MISAAELQAQADGLAKQIAVGVPDPIAAIVIFFNRASGEAVLKAVRMNDGLKNEVLRAFVRGAGSQSVQERVE